MALVIFGVPDSGTLDCPPCGLPTIPLDGPIEVGARFLCLGCCRIYTVTNVEPLTTEAADADDVAGEGAGS